MIKAEILEALPKLNAEERREIRAKLNELDSETWFDNGELSEQEKSDNRSAPGRVRPKIQKSAPPGTRPKARILAGLHTE